MSSIALQEFAEADRIIRNALKEDIRSGDITTNATISSRAQGHAVIIARSQGILSGITLCSRAFTLLNDNMALHCPLEDGSWAHKNEQVLEIHGAVSTILKGERTALNILCRMSGISTLTRKFVNKTAGTGVKILDTRKTMPGLRVFDKYAVRMGGGYNHRHALDEMFLIKENHSTASGGVESAVKKCLKYRKKHALKAVIVAEATTLDEAAAAAEAGADRILLDNMRPSDIRKVVKKINGAVELEVSGGITLKNVLKFAETGVDYISVGSLTHSVPAMDFSLLLL